MNERCRTPKVSLAVVSTAGTDSGSTTTLTTSPSISDSSSPWRLRNPSRYPSRRSCRSPSGNVTATSGRPLWIGGLLGGAVLLGGLGLAAVLPIGLLGPLLLLELLLDLLRDPADVGLGGGRHAFALEDVGALEGLYALEARGLALADLLVLPLREVLHDVALFVHEGRSRLLVADLPVALDLFLERHDAEHERLGPGRTPRYVDVDGYDSIGPHQDGISV